jgi:hypothetical protein
MMKYGTPSIATSISRIRLEEVELNPDLSG